MNRRGGRRTPAKIKELTGNPGRRPTPKTPAFKRTKTIDPPAHLGSFGQAEWRKIMPELTKLGLVRRVDLAT